MLALALVAIAMTGAADTAASAEPSCVQSSSATDEGGSGSDVDPQVNLAGRDMTVFVVYETPVMTGYQTIRISCRSATA